jgi:SAM-dependent methyltransferase
MVRTFDAGTDFAERILGWHDPFVPPLRLRLRYGPFLDPRAFTLSAERNLAGLRALCNLLPTARVLDIGCGCGRNAVAFVRYLEHPGTHDGFDTAKEPVEWCQSHIESRVPNFHFRYTDTFNQRYNPAGKIRATEFTFPYESEHFDFAFACSIYPHLLPNEVANFVTETARVLRPGGLSCATFCLLNERSFPFVAAGKSWPPLLQSFGDCRVRDTDDLSSFIAHPETFVRMCYSRSGLRVVGPVRYGPWVGTMPYSPGVLGPYGFDQDIVIASKPVE